MKLRFLSVSILSLASAFVSTNAFSTTDSMDPLLGEMKWVAFNFAPRGWTTCDGQILPIANNQALFSLIGTIYGGDGRTTFALPDLRGRLMLHDSDDYRLGSRGGEESNTLTIANLPSHTHSLSGSSARANSTLPDDRSPANTSRTKLYGNGAIDKTMDGDTISATGGSQPHNNMMPSTTLNCIIALQGRFPPRQ